ncbi:MAG: hypothetical protein OHK0022_45070 [Roseiflexaceae bacterium]
MDKNLQNPNLVYTIEGDTYRLHHRPNYAHIVINNDYKGVAVVDPLSNVTVAERNFPEGYSSSGVIDHWLFSADGSKLLAVCEDDRSIALIDLIDSQGSSLVEYPPVDISINTAYIWNETLIFASGMVSQYFALEKQKDTFTFTEKRSIDIRLQYPGWRRAVDQVYSNKWSLGRIDSNLSTLWYYDSHSSPSALGMLNWNTNNRFSVAIDGNVPRFASDWNHLFALQEHLLRVFDTKGNLVSRLEPAKDFSFFDVDIVPYNGQHILTLLSTSIRENVAQLLVYVFST